MNEPRKQPTLVQQWVARAVVSVGTFLVISKLAKGKDQVIKGVLGSIIGTIAHEALDAPVAQLIAIAA